MASIAINLPEDLMGEIGKDKVQKLALEALLVRLYELGEVSSGKAASILGVTRREFLDVLGSYGVSEFDENADIAAEAQHG